MTESPMNIVYLCANSGLDLEKMLGPKIHIQAILRGLKNQNINPTLVAVQKSDSIQGYEEFEAVILPHRYLRGFVHRIIPYTGIVDSLRIFLKILTLNRTRHFDLIHERYTGLSWGGMLTAKCLRIPYILQMVGPGIEEKEIQGNKIKGSKKAILLFHQKLMLNNQQGLIIISRKIADFIKTRRGWKIPNWQVIPDSADSNFEYNQQNIEVIRNKYDLDGYKVLIYSGSLYRWYGILQVIKAFKIVTDQIPKVKLLLIGNGDAINEIINYTIQNDIQDQVKIIPPISRPELHNYLQLSDIALAHYIKEHNYTGNTAKISEYLAASKVVVTTPNMNELVKDGYTGFISPSFSIEDYAKTIIRALNCENKKIIGENAHNLILKYYTWNHYIEKLLKIYKYTK